MGRAEVTASFIKDKSQTGSFHNLKRWVKLFSWVELWFFYRSIISLFINWFECLYFMSSLYFPRPREKLRIFLAAPEETEALIRHFLKSKGIPDRPGFYKHLNTSKTQRDEAQLINSTWEKVPIRVQKGGTFNKKSIFLEIFSPPKLN